MSGANSPFKFLDSYQQADADVFFGREKETQDLYNALSGVKHLLVYGPSGSGKTSLVECGLRNQFSDADWFAVTIRRGNNINSAVFTSINEVLLEKIETDPVSKMPVNPDIEFGQAIEHLFAERYQPVYLLFDQFEELLISGEEAEKNKFFTLLNKLIRNKVPCRILLIMREEFLGYLSEFEPLCPTIFHHRFRVEKMGRKNVKNVIYKILEAPRYRSYFNINDSEKLAQDILSKLPDRKKEIELAHVQVFLRELWERAQLIKKSNEVPVLSSALIKDSDNLEGILESFLKEQIADLEPNYGEKVPLELLDVMITERFTKLQLSEEDIKAGLELKNVVSKKLVAELLAELKKRLIIRTTKAGNETQYEISHDVLALVIGQNRTEEMKMRKKAEDIYKVYLERTGLFTQDDIDYLRPFQKSLAYPTDLHTRIDESIVAIKKQREQELVKTRKRLSIVYSILGVALLALVTAGYFGNMANIAKNEAQMETKKSQILTLAALAGEQMDKNPTFAICLAQQAWQKSPTHPPTPSIQRIVSKVFYESMESNKLFYTNNLEHDAAVTSAVFSPDGKKIVTASRDNTAKIWDADSGKEIANLTGHQSYVTSAVFSPDGKKIVTASDDNTAKIWDADSGKEIVNLTWHQDAVFSAVFSPDGKKIVTASGDNTAKIWDADSGKEINTLTGHQSSVTSAVFSPNGKKIVTASGDNTAKIWDADSGKKINTLTGHQSSVTNAVFSPDGKKIVTASRDKTAKIWDADSGKEIANLTGHQSYVTNAVFSPDGKKIVTASDDNTAKIWDAETGKEITNLTGHQGAVSSAVFSPDGNKIVTASGDNTAKIWDADSGKEIVNLTGHQYSVTSAVFSPDGNKIVTTSSYDNTAKIWDADSGKELHKLSGHEDNVYSAVFSPDGKKIVTASGDNTAKIWDADTGNEIVNLTGHQHAVYSAVFSPDGKKIVTASFDNTAKIWDAETGKEIVNITGHQSSVYSAVFSPDGNKIVTASRDKTTKIWLTPEGIIDWMDRQKNIYRLTNEDLKNLGIDFIDLE